MLDRGTLRGLPSGAEFDTKSFSIAAGGRKSAMACVDSATMGYADAASPSGPQSPAHGVGPSPALEATSQGPVSSLRDRLLSEAKHERQRYLEVTEAAERRLSNRAAEHQRVKVQEVSTQTDPVAFAADASSASLRNASPSASRRASTCSLEGASHQDEDEAQMEAIRMLAKLSELGGQSQVKEAHVSQLNKQLETERVQREIADSHLANVISAKQNTHEQIICLETELDNRESALQATEETLQRRTAELEQALLHIRALEAGYACSSPNDNLIIESECRYLRSQMTEKDRYIARLSGVLRTRGVYLEEDCATACGSDRSALTALTVSTAASMGQMSSFTFK